MINRRVTAVSSLPMAKHREGEILEAPVSELYSSQVLRHWKNSLKYPFFQHASRSRLESGECLQAGCLQEGRERFEHYVEVYSLNCILQEEEKGLVDSVNLFAELTSIWQPIHS